MIKIIVDTSNATETEIEELNRLIPFGREQFHFDKNNIKVEFLTKEHIEIAKANNTTIESGLSIPVILGTIPRNIN